VNETYVRGGEAQARRGGVLLAAISILSAVLVIAGLFYATGIGSRRKVLLAAGGCAPVPSLSKTGLDCTTEQQLASQYTKMTAPAIQQLNTDVAAYTASEFGNLAAAKAALTAEVTLANSLDTSLARFPFPPAIAPTAKKLIRDDDVLIRLKAEQARSTSLAQLRSFDGQVEAASGAVQADLQLVGTALAKPPAANQEP
jgi:hypothetical protein